jgi:2-aminoethylphosphonate-pyruvate transaminase
MSSSPFRKPVLFTPGPVRVPRSVALSFIDPPCNYHRQAAFRELFAETQQLLKALIGVKDADAYAAVILTSTGTGANEACLHALAPLGAGLIVSNGFFGARLTEQARQGGILHDVLEAPSHQPVEVARLERELDRRPDVAWVYFIGHETRAGLRNPLEEMGRACRRRHLVVAADIVSSAYAYPVDIEAAGLDLAVTSSAKGLMSVPGLGIVFVRNQTMTRMTSRRGRSYYLDLAAEWRVQRAELQPRFAQPVALHAALHAACRHLARVGIGHHMDRIGRQMNDLVTHLEGLGVRAQLEPRHRSNVAVNFSLPAGFTYRAFASALEQQGYYVLYGLPGDETTFQLSTIGDLSDEHVAGMKLALSRVLSPPAGDVGHRD